MRDSYLPLVRDSHLAPTRAGIPSCVFHKTRWNLHPKPPLKRPNDAPPPKLQRIAPHTPAAASRRTRAARKKDAPNLVEVRGVTGGVGACQMTADLQRSHY